MPAASPVLAIAPSNRLLPALRYAWASLLSFARVLRDSVHTAGKASSPVTHPCLLGPVDREHS